MAMTAWSAKVFRSSTCQVDQLAVEPEDGPRQSVAQAHGVLGDRVEDGLDVALRPADHAQDLARRRLLLEGLREVAVARLPLGEEADVLDGDDGLTGEGLEQGDLRTGERYRLAPRDRDGPDRLTIPQHRDRQDSPHARQHDAMDVQLGISGEVRNMGHGPGQDRSSGDAAPSRGPGKRAPDGVELLGAVAVVCRKVDEGSVEQEHGGV
jgi:hypothetical protein